MLFKKAKKRLVILISISFIILTLISSIIVLNDNILYFLSPTSETKNINLKNKFELEDGKKRVYSCEQRRNKIYYN